MKKTKIEPVEKIKKSESTETEYEFYKKELEITKEIQRLMDDPDADLHKIEILNNNRNLLFKIRLNLKQERMNR